MIAGSHHGTNRLARAGKQTRRSAGDPRFGICLAPRTTLEIPSTRPTAAATQWASAAVINIETAVMSWAEANGLAIIKLFGTPFDVQSWALSPLR